MKSRTILYVLTEAFHAVPEECWTPRAEPMETRRDIFWLQHLYSGEYEIKEAEAVWIETGAWPELSERARYFARLRFEDVARILSSEEAPDISGEFAHILDDGIDGRIAISTFVPTMWTRDMAQMWAAEAAKYGNPRRVYMPNLKQSPDQKKL